MSGIGRKFMVAGMAVSMTLAAQSARAQNTPRPTPPAYSTDVAEEEVFHRLKELDRKRDRFAKTIPAQEWQTAFLGWGDKQPSPQYLASLFRKYDDKKTTRKAKQQTIQWVEILADELVQRGDAHMFLLLASHYVAYNKSDSYYSPFRGANTTFGLSIDRIGKLLQKSLATLSTDEQTAFRKDLALATAAQVVETGFDENERMVSKPRGDLINAILGYELLTRYAPGDDALTTLDDEINKVTFTAKDLQGLLTAEGIRDFEWVASGFLPITQDRSPLSHLLKLGLRADKRAGEALRDMFIDAIKTDKPADALFSMDHTYELAAQQRFAGMSDTLAQQMLSPIWDEAVASIMTPKIMQSIYLKQYLTPGARIPRTFSVARFKRLTPAQETEMQGVYIELLKATAKKPEAFYKLVDDFSGESVFRAAMANTNTTLLAQNIMPHVAYLAGVYIADANVGATINSNVRMMHLMQLDGTLPVAQRVTTTAFQREVFLLARAVKGNTVQTQRLAQFLQTAMNVRWDDNKGWRVHITKPFIEALRKTMQMPKGTQTDDTLNVLLELKDHYTRIDAEERTRSEADRRARERAWQARTQVKRNAR